MSTYRIMVVDDDPDIRFVIAGLLGSDFESVEAENGLDALEKIDRYQPDLMLVDIGMPIMDGFATCRGVRRHDEFGDMPVFFVTGHTSQEARDKAREAGCHAYFEKPFDSNALIADIRRFFADSGRPPRTKLFTMEDLRRIDATPLRAAEQEPPEEDLADQPTAPLADTQAPGITEPEPSEEDKRGGIRIKRRRGTLGSTSPQEVPAAAEAAPPERPAAPAQDVGALLDRLKALQPPPAEKPPAAEPPSRPTRPVPRPTIPEPPGEPKRPPAPREPEPPPLVPPSALPKRQPEPPPAPPPPPRPAAPPPPPRIPEPPAPPPKPRVPEPPPAIPPRPTPPAAPPAPRPAPPRAPEPPPAIPPRPTPPAAPPAPRAAPPPPPPPRPVATPPVPPAAPVPAMPAPERLRPHRPIPAAAKTGAKAATRPRVLCLINSRPELMAYTEALKGLGEFLPLEDPVEAIEIVARFQPDIVYMNIVAEAYSGLQLAQLFRSNPRLAHIEVVFLFTGRETPAQLQAAQRLTSNPQLRSPITSDQARATLQAIIAKPGFKVRQKKLGYGAYVDEVLRKEREKHEEERKKREKAFYEEKHEDLVVGIQEALRNFRPDPAHEALVTKNLQAYYLEE